MKRSACFLGSLALLPVSTVAHADALYTLTLTSAEGNPGGTGTLSLNIAPPSTGTVVYADTYYVFATPGYSYQFSVSVAVPEPGGVFPYSPPSYTSNFNYVQSVDGVLSLFGFSYQHVTGFPSSFLNFGVSETSYLYHYQNVQNGRLVNYDDAGTVSLSPAAASTPELTSIAFLATGMLAGAGLLRHRVLLRSARNIRPGGTCAPLDHP